MKTLRVRTLDQWRDWLTEHHASESEIWLIFNKRHTGVASIDYSDSASPAPEVLKAVARANQKNAGIYGTVTRIGLLAFGQTIFLHPAAER